MQPSLTRRLLALYVAMILVVVGIAAGLVWVMMRSALRTALDQSLQAEALALAGRLEVEHGQLEFEQATGYPRTPQPADALVQIVDERGRVVFSSPGLTNDRALIDQQLVPEPRGAPLWFTLFLTPNQGTFRVVALHTAVHPDDEFGLDAAKDGAVGAWVLVARPLAPVNRTLGQLTSVLVLAMGAAVLAALVGGFLAVRRGMQPVRALARSVGRVNPADPKWSVDHGQVPVELEPIVRTTERLLECVRGELSRQRQLTADVAHDLRTPVAGVRTLLDVCLQRARASQEYVTAIENARAALRQLSQLLDDVLTLSRLDAGVDQPVWAHVALEDVLAAGVATVQPLAAARDVTLEITMCPRIDLRTDRGKLEKILANLLSNAVQHSPTRQVVRLTARIDGEALELAVTDFGPGVRPEMRARIFDRFVRGDAARAGGDGHHGLGLPIAAGLARVLGGEIKLDEQHAPASRFVVRLPLQ